MQISGPILLAPVIQKYDWGKVGKCSTIYNLIGDVSCAKDPLAEAWYGAHPKFPSPCPSLQPAASDSISLAELLGMGGREILGPKVFENFNSSLPWLFKVLSVKKPLSLQVHPDTEKAKLLHEKLPLQYPEASPKPEIFVALSDVVLVAGLRTMQAIEKKIERVPELAELLSNSKYTDHASLLRGWLSSSKEKTLPLLARLLNRLSDVAVLNDEDCWAKKLAKADLSRDKPGDPAVFAPYILNLLEVKSGNALYVPANTLHAYFSGDIVECMATSDFVIRAGLTNKPVDLDSLLEVANYEPWTPPIDQGQIIKRSQFIKFTSNAQQFELHMATGSNILERHTDLDSPHFYFAYNGEGTLIADGHELKLRRGTAVLLPASTKSYQVRFSGLIFKVTIP